MRRDAGQGDVAQVEGGRLQLDSGFVSRSVSTPWFAAATLEPCHFDLVLQERNPGVRGTRQMPRSFVVPQGPTPQNETFSGFSAFCWEHSGRLWQIAVGSLADNKFRGSPGYEELEWRWFGTRVLKARTWASVSRSSGGQGPDCKP